MRTTDLEELGLEKKEAAVYLAALEAGNDTALAISKKARLPRSTTHDVLRLLIGRGLVSSYRKKNKIIFAVTDPSILQTKLDRQNDILKRMLPDLEAHYLRRPTKPRVRFYESRQGVEVATREMVKETKEMVFVSAAVSFYKSFPEYFEVISSQRIKHGVRARALLTNEPGVEEWRSHDREKLRESRLLPAGMNLDAMLWLWNDKAVFFNTSDECSVLIVEDKPITDMLKKMFEGLWGVGRV